MDAVGRAPSGEQIELDATVTGMIQSHVYRAVLENGHTVVAFAGGSDRDRADGLQPGDQVRLKLSPYDLSRGRLVFERPEDER